MKQTDGKDDNRVTVDDHVNEADDPLAEEFDTTDLPTSLIITNIDSRCFAATSDIRDYFEDTFKTFDPSATFQYFKSFRRVRVNYGDGMSAAQARIRCHQMRVGDEIINCYFAGPTLPNKSDPNDVHLHPPAPVKQFLISPPASPPVGWKPRDEAEPCINVDLLSALANLTPGAAHELHPQSDSQPGIVVHVCEEDEMRGLGGGIGGGGVGLQDRSYKPKIKIQQTARPSAVVQRSLSEGSEGSECATPP